MRQPFLLPTRYRAGGKKSTGKEPHTNVLQKLYGTSLDYGGLRQRRASAPEIREWFAIDPVWARHLRPA